MLKVPAPASGSAASGCDGSGPQSSAADSQAGPVRGAAGQRHHRSVPVPGGRPDGGSRGPDRVPAQQQAEVPGAAGPASPPGPAGLRLLPAVPGGVQLGPGPAAAGATGSAWTRTSM